MKRAFTKRYERKRGKIPAQRKHPIKNQPQLIQINASIQAFANNASLFVVLPLRLAEPQWLGTFFARRTRRAQETSPSAP
jgi:hypothetical protein